MPGSSLARLQIGRRSGAEPFRGDGQAAGSDLLDFWRWSTSDLVTNTTRGVLAEYVMARPLGIRADWVREACRDRWWSFGGWGSTGAQRVGFAG